MKLRTKVILLVGALTLILSGIMVAFLELSLKENFKKQFIDSVSITNEALEGEYYAFIKGLENRGVDWSTDKKIRKLTEVIVGPATQKTDREKAVKDLDTYLNEEKIFYEKDAIIVDILDAHGIVVASTREKRIGVDEKKEEVDNHSHFFSKAINSVRIGESFVRGVVFEEDEADGPMTHVSTRVFSLEKDAQGNPIPLPAVMLVHFTPARQIQGILNGDLQNSEGGNSAYSLVKTFKSANVFIINKDRRVVFSAHAGALVDRNQRVDSPVVEACLHDGKETQGEYMSWNKVMVIGSSMCLTRDELVLLTQIDTDEMLDAVNVFIERTLYGMIVVVVLMMFFVVLVIRRPLNSLELMGRVAEKVARGDFRERANILSGDELGILARAFNKMLDALEFSRGEIQKADEKLKEEAAILAHDIEEHKKQEVFLEESKKAQLNLLEDSWKAKERLELESRRLQTILSSIGHGLLLIDGKYNIVLVNPALEEMFGFSKEELLGKDIRTLMKLWRKRKEEIPPEKWPTEEVFITKKIITTDLDDELYITTEHHREHIPVGFSISPLEGAGVVGAVVVIRDMTKDRELDDAKSGFISVASHQLRTPLTSIRWYAEMLLSEDAGALNPAQMDFLKEIHGGAERLYQTVDLLLGLSRVESGKMKVEKSDIDLTIFTGDVEKEMTSLAAEKKVTLKTFPPEGEVLHVFLDSLTLRQVIINLVSNAIRYSNEWGTVESRWWRDGNGDIVYAVRDFGIGIPESQRSRIFSKFFRAENALQKAPDGSGLGLALVKELVEAWGGRVWFETAEGHGTTFYFTIPKELPQTG